jgi:hypothetical protein
MGASIFHPRDGHRAALLSGPRSGGPASDAGPRCPSARTAGPHAGPGPRQRASPLDSLSAALAFTLRALSDKRKGYGFVVRSLAPRPAHAFAAACFASSVGSPLAKLAVSAPPRNRRRCNRLFGTNSCSPQKSALPALQWDECTCVLHHPRPGLPEADRAGLPHNLKSPMLTIKVITSPKAAIRYFEEHLSRDGHQPDPHHSPPRLRRSGRRPAAAASQAQSTKSAGGTKRKTSW